MIIVRELFAEYDCCTRVWVSPRVVKAIKKRDGRDRQQLMERLKRYATNGFWKYEGRSLPIREEGDRVYRIGHDTDMFRIIGFYEDEHRTDFIAIDAFKKSGQQLSPRERRRIDEVARVKEQNDWKREQ